MQTFDFRTATYRVISSEYEPLDVTSNTPDPDPNWKFVDAHGHGHFYHTQEDPYPTLLEIVRTGYDPDFGESYTYRVGWRCRHCRRRIEPGMLPVSNTRTYIPGLRTWSLELTLPLSTPETECMRVLNAVNDRERCQFQLPGNQSGMGFVTEALWATEGPLRVTIQGTGPVTPV